MADVQHGVQRIYLLLLINYSAYFLCQVVAEDLGVVKKVNSFPISLQQKCFFLGFLGAPVRYFFYFIKLVLSPFQIVSHFGFSRYITVYLDIAYI
jgi:hypothetical protein